MSQYQSLLPENIPSDTFEYDGNTFSITASSIERSQHNNYWYARGFFIQRASGYQDMRWQSANVWPPHWLCLSSEHVFMTDQFEFNATWDLVSMTIKDYTIEVSMNGTDWNKVYTGLVPAQTDYRVTCAYEPVVCKYIRLKVLSTYDTRGYKWAIGYNGVVYGTIVNRSNLFEDSLDNMYGILK